MYRYRSIEPHKRGGVNVTEYAWAHPDEWYGAVDDLLERYASGHSDPRHEYDVPEVWEPLIRLIKDPWADDAEETVDKTVDWLRSRCQFNPGSVEPELMDGLGELYYTGSFPRVVWAVVLIRDGHRCSHCGRPDDPGDWKHRLDMEDVGPCWMWDDPEVHRTRCRPCHAREETGEGRRGQPQCTLDRWAA